MSEPSIFSRILKGEIPAEIIAETENAFVIRDIAPKARPASECAHERGPSSMGSAIVAGTLPE